MMDVVKENVECDGVGVGVRGPSDFMDGACQ